MIDISILILTKNEEKDLPGCLDSVSWSDDIHVLDSMSEDATVEIAKAAGATVTQRQFSGYASQRNAGLALPFKHEWILVLDADERVPPQLREEMAQAILSSEPGDAAFRFRRRDIWWGRWLRHAQISPFFVRLVRKGAVRYEREINEVLMVDGVIRDLRSTFDHFPFSKGLSHWVSKHNVYSTMEAKHIISSVGLEVSLYKALFCRDFNERRVHQKRFFYRMPFRPLVKFAYMILLRRAFLDGWAGVRYSILQAFYEYLIVLKVKELHNTK